MSEQNPYVTLGVTEESSFDEVQDAKERLMSQYSDDRKQQELIEHAYDTILMDRWRMRQEGRIKVPDRIRFPEKLVQPPANLTPTPRKQAPSWLQRLLDTPSRNDILWTAGIFTALGSISFFYGGVNPNILQLSLSLGLVASLFFLNRKERKFGRALLLTLLGLILGLVVGGFISSFVTVSWITGDRLTTLIIFVLLWLVDSFLR